jgi:hypothetical protein
VILLEREDNTIPVGLNLFPGPNENMTVSWGFFMGVTTTI